MNATKLRENLQQIQSSAYQQQAKADALQAVQQFTKSSCYRPRKMSLSISDLGTLHNLYVRCGKCNYCRDMFQDEWFTRMWHETLAHKYAYLVTLHYRGFDNYEDIPQMLLSAYYHRDNVNYTKHMQYHPCLCRIEHFQYFIKRLRKNCGFPIRYFGSLEYGHTYGRPHAHIIIWCDQPLEKSHVYNAWSCNIGTRKVPQYVSIGNFDFEDLNANGTICKQITIDKKQYDSKFAFKYLSKYCNKYEECNYQRVKYLLDDLKNFALVPSSPAFQHVFGDLDKWINKLYCDTNVINTYYEKDSLILEKLVYDNLMCLADKGLRAFSSIFRAKTTCSRGEGIGSLYLVQNLERMESGNFQIFDRQHGRMVCPRYYVRKVREILNPIQLRSQNLNSSSYSAQSRPIVIRNLESVLSFPNLPTENPYIVKNIDLSTATDEVLSELLHSPWSMKNCLTHERMIIVGSDNPFSSCPNIPFVFAFKYDIHQRKYVQTRSFSVLDFTKQYIDMCNKSAEFTRPLINLAEKSTSDLDIARDLFDTIFYSTDWKYENMSPFNYYHTNNVDYLEDKRKAHDNKKYDNFSPKIF